MLLSMTGYGRTKGSFKEKSITIEIRSLNSKFTDVRMKIPQNFKEKEPEIRRILSEHVERGKIDFSLDVKSVYGDDEFGLNQALFKKYFTELSKLKEELNIPNGDIVQSILRLPNVVASDENDIEEQEWKAVLNTLNEALTKFSQYRLDEGKAMEGDLTLRVKNIKSLLQKLNPFEEERINKLRQRIYSNLEEYLGKDKIDENRFEQEIIFYLEKIDVTEEKVRLEQHCNYFIEELQKDVRIKGRKLSFISQEMGREINTLGAKAYSSDIQRVVVGMKDELEKIKEQVANSV